jgi:xylulokinase
MEYLLGIDLGTSGLKAVVFDLEGREHGRGYVPARYLEADGGAAQQEAESWWTGCCRAIRSAVAQAGISPDRVRGIGVCGFHHCPVFVDEKTRPVRPVIVTHDRRLEETLQELSHQGILRRIAEATGSRVTMGHFPVIYRYLREKESASIAGARWILLAKDFLRCRLTGQIATELCDATGTHLVAMPGERWSEDLCELLDVPKRLLPQIGRSDRIAGQIIPEAAEQCGLLPGTPVAFGGGDSHCALLGLGVIEAGQTGLLLGTNSTLRRIFAAVPRKDDPPVWVQRHVVADLYTASASSMAGAGIMGWFKEVFCGDITRQGSEAEAYQKLDALAGSVEPGADGLLFVPYLLGERSPFYNPRARASFLGISQGHTMGHFVRGLMEGVALATANNLRVLQHLQPPARTGERCGSEYQIIRTGKSGGGLLKTWRQILCDALGCCLEIMDVSESGCLGAAMLAGMATGVYRDEKEAVSTVTHEDTVLHPDPACKAFYEVQRTKLNRAYQALEPVLYGGG